MPKGFYKRSEKMINHLRKWSSNQKGIKKNEIHKKRIGQSNKGKHNYSEEIKKKIGEASRKRKHSQYVKNRIRLSVIEKAKRGIYHWNWKGGITPIKNQIRHYFKYREWRSDIFTRDNWTCVWCYKKGGKLQVDHYPKSFSSLIKEYKIKSVEEVENCEEFWNINNGRTLCIDCHRKTDNYLKNN